jgi:hypothetical protein
VCARHADGLTRRTKLTPEDVVAIRVARAEGLGVYALAAEWGVTPNHVSRICTGGVWPDLGGPITRRFFRR